jgi:uncharacterized protein YxjI
MTLTPSRSTGRLRLHQMDCVSDSLSADDRQEASMGLFHHHANEPHRRFRMQQKLISIGDDYWIEDDDGNRAYKVNGKAARMRETFMLEDTRGHTVAKIQEKKLSVRDKVTIDLDIGSATVKKAMVGFRDRFEIDLENGPDLKAHGNIVDHEYKIERKGDTIAEISKKWFRVRDTYGIDVFDENATVLLLSITVAIDALANDLL